MLSELIIYKQSTRNNKKFSNKVRHVQRSYLKIIEQENLVLIEGLRVKKYFYLNSVRQIIHDSNFADWKLKFEDILVIELEFKLSPKPFSHMPDRFKEFQKGLHYIGNRSGEIELRRTLAFTLCETGTCCRPWSKEVTDSDLHVKILRRDCAQQGLKRETSQELMW